MHLIESFVRNPVKVTVGVILVMLFGIIAIRSMPMQLTPEVQIPTLTIETRWPGASPQEVEREIIQEQEEQLKSVEGVRKMTPRAWTRWAGSRWSSPSAPTCSEALLKVNTSLQQVREYPGERRRAGHQHRRTAPTGRSPGSSCRRTPPTRGEFDELRAQASASLTRRAAAGARSPQSGPDAATACGAWPRSIRRPTTLLPPEQRRHRRAAVRRGLHRSPLRARRGRLELQRAGRPARRRCR